MTIDKILSNHWFSLITLGIMLLFICPSLVHSQASELRIGQWKAHLPYHSGIWVTQSESTIYYASPFALFSIEKEDFAVDFISKVDGLSDVGIDKINYNTVAKTLVIIYNNSNIDLYSDTGVINLNDIQKNTSITGDRSVYNILFEGNAAFLSTGFGIVKLNLDKAEFEFTTFTGLAVRDLALHNNVFYAATDEGVYIANNDPNLNLADFNNWQLLDVDAGFPPVYSTNAIASYKNVLYLDIDGILYKYRDGNLAKLHEEADFEVNFLSTGVNNLIAGLACQGNCRGKVLFFKEDDSFVRAGGRCIDRPRYAIEEENGRIWYADQYRGIRFAENSNSACNPLDFNSPGSHNSSEILIANEQLYVAAGGVNSNQTALNRVDGIFIRDEDKEWQVKNRGTVPIFLEEDIDRDFHRLAVHPTDGRIFAGTFWGGLTEYDGENFKVYNEKNSSLQGAIGDGARERIGGLAFDEDNNLWMSNHAAARPISVLKTDGEWRNFNAPVKSLLQLTVDLNGYKWFVAGNEGVLVFDDNQTIDNTNDDRYRLFTPANSELPTPRVNCLEMDLDGDIWVGTTEGPVIFECGSVVFDDCRGSRRIVEQDGFGAYLLETENIQTIAVDGANRKWIGTNNGLFIQSPNGEEQIAFFNKTNSPLFDNTIIDIAINQATGEAFIGTNNGIISLRGEAIEGTHIHSSEVYAFPNPVRPEYSGPIAIKGLARNANVKITDVSGQLIFETTALGGQAIWNGKDFSGRKASTGVYLVFSTSSRGLNNPNTAVTKILFVN